MFNTLKLIGIQRNVVSGIANIVLVSIMEPSNLLHDVWFDIFFLIESQLSNLCFLKFYKVLNIMTCRCTDYFPHIAGYLILRASYPAIFNSSESKCIAVWRKLNLYKYMNKYFDGLIFNSFLLLKS